MRVTEVNVYIIRNKLVNPPPPPEPFDVMIAFDKSGSMGAIAPPKGDEFGEAMSQLIPLGRLAVPREIAMPVLFLASDDAAYMLGASLIVDGGYTAP